VRHLAPARADDLCFADAQASVEQGLKASFRKKAPGSCPCNQWAVGRNAKQTQLGPWTPAVRPITCASLGHGARPQGQRRIHRSSLPPAPPRAPPIAQRAALVENGADPMRVSSVTLPFHPVIVS